ncbi:MAG: hypothetical protein H6Q68_3256 [Firmicutes bacterium]|nr:hypothetical protein [Bacillota bacterium]
MINRYTYREMGQILTVNSNKNIIEAEVKYSEAKKKVDGCFRTVSYKNGKGENYVSNRSYGYTMGR